jgi:putative transposase
MHCIWTLPPDDDDYSGRWRALKNSFTKDIPPGEHRSPARWPYSTVHRCLAMGPYPADWAGGQAVVEGGERR